MTSSTQARDVIPVDLGALSAACAELARDGGRAGDSSEVLDKVVSLSGSVVLGCEHASVTVVDDGPPHSPAATTTAMRAFDAVQYDGDRGPCLTAAREDEVVVVEDVHVDPRWPGLRDRTPVDVRAVLCVPVTVGERAVGALNLAAGTPAAFPPVSRQQATVLASTTGALLLAARERQRADQLHRSLAQSRRRRHDSDAAYVQLRRDLRSALTTMRAGMSVLVHRRGQLDRRGREALDLLVAEVDWHEHLSMTLLRSELPVPRGDAPQAPQRPEQQGRG